MATKYNITITSIKELIEFFKIVAKAVFWSWIMRYELFDASTQKAFDNEELRKWIRHNVPKVKYCECYIQGELTLFGVLMPKDDAIIFRLKFGL